MVNKQLLLQLRREFQDFRDEIRQRLNHNNIPAVNPVDFGIEMPIQNLNDFRQFDLTLNDKDTENKFVCMHYNACIYIILLILLLSPS